jgi:hypothetical protein
MDHHHSSSEQLPQARNDAVTKIKQELQLEPPIRSGRLGEDSTTEIVSLNIALNIVAEFFKAKRSGKIPPEKFGQLCAVIYAYSEAGQQLTRGYVNALLKLADGAA